MKKLPIILVILIFIGSFFLLQGFDQNQQHHEWQDKNDQYYECPYPKSPIESGCDRIEKENPESDGVAMIFMGGFLIVLGGSSITYIRMD